MTRKIEHRAIPLLILLTAPACIDDAPPGDEINTRLGAELFVPPPCAPAESCITSATQAPALLEDLHFLAPLIGAAGRSGDAPCDFTIGMCAYVVNTDALVIAQLKEPEQSIPYSCEEPGRYGRTMFRLRMDVHAVFSDLAIPSSLEAIMRPDDYWFFTWAGPQLMRLRYLDGEWAVLGRTLIGTEDDLQRLGLPVDECAHFNLPTTLEAFRDQATDLRIHMAERCSSYLDQLRSDEELARAHYGRQPLCSYATEPEPAEDELPDDQLPREDP